MGMPRQIADEVNAYLDNAGKDPHYVSKIVIYAIRKDEEFASRANGDDDEKCPTAWHFLRCRYKHNKRKELVPKVEQPDSLENIPAQLYAGIGSTGKAEFRAVNVPRFFVPSLQRLNAERIAADQSQLMLRDQVLAAENKVYRSRNFPPNLRAMIFARDGFCCQACGRNRDELMREGSHLQVDHKVAWEDGGETKYSNGETLCRECNHAKHTTKKYWHAKEALWGRRE